MQMSPSDRKQKPCPGCGRLVPAIPVDIPGYETKFIAAMCDTCEREFNRKQTENEEQVTSALPPPTPDVRMSLIKSGFPEYLIDLPLDKKTPGNPSFKLIDAIADGQSSFLYGRPGSGKTTYATKAAKLILENNKRAIVERVAMPELLAHIAAEYSKPGRTEVTQTLSSRFIKANYFVLDELSAPTKLNETSLRIIQLTLEGRAQRDDRTTVLISNEGDNRLLHVYPGHILSRMHGCCPTQIVFNGLDWRTLRQKP